MMGLCTTGELIIIIFTFLFSVLPRSLAKFLWGWRKRNIDFYYDEHNRVAVIITITHNLIINSGEGYLFYELIRILHPKCQLFSQCNNIEVKVLS